MLNYDDLCMASRGRRTSQFKRHLVNEYTNAVYDAQPIGSREVFVRLKEEMDKFASEFAVHVKNLNIFNKVRKYRPDFFENADARAVVMEAQKKIINTSRDWLNEGCIISSTKKCKSPLRCVLARHLDVYEELDSNTRRTNDLRLCNILSNGIKALSRSFSKVYVEKVFASGNDAYIHHPSIFEVIYNIYRSTFPKVYGSKYDLKNYPVSSEIDTWEDSKTEMTSLLTETQYKELTNIVAAYESITVDFYAYDEKGELVNKLNVELQDGEASLKAAADVPVVDLIDRMLLSIVYLVGIKSIDLHNTDTLDEKHYGITVVVKDVKVVATDTVKTFTDKFYKAGLPAGISKVGSDYHFDSYTGLQSMYEAQSYIYNIVKGAVNETERKITSNTCVAFMSLARLQCAAMISLICYKLTQESRTKPLIDHLKDKGGEKLELKLFTLSQTFEDENDDFFSGIQDEVTTQIKSVLDAATRASEEPEVIDLKKREYCIFLEEFKKKRTDYDAYVDKLIASYGASAGDDWGALNAGVVDAGAFLKNVMIDVIMGITYNRIKKNLSLSPRDLKRCEALYGNKYVLPFKNEVYSDVSILFDCMDICTQNKREFAAACRRLERVSTTGLSYFKKLPGTTSKSFYEVIVGGDIKAFVQNHVKLQNYVNAKAIVTKLGDLENERKKKGNDLTVDEKRQQTQKKSVVSTNQGDVDKFKILALTYKEMLTLSSAVVAQYLYQTMSAYWQSLDLDMQIKCNRNEETSKIYSLISNEVKDLYLIVKSICYK